MKSRRRSTKACNQNKNLGHMSHSISSYFCLVKVDGKQFGQLNRIISYTAVNPMEAEVLNDCVTIRTFDTYLRGNRPIKIQWKQRVSIPPPRACKARALPSELCSRFVLDRTRVSLALES